MCEGFIQILTLELIYIHTKNKIIETNVLKFKFCINIDKVYLVLHDSILRFFELTKSLNSMDPIKNRLCISINIIQNLPYNYIKDPVLVGSGCPYTITAKSLRILEGSWKNP